MDYTATELRSYLKSGTQKSWVDLVDARWPNVGHGWWPVDRYHGDPSVCFRWSQQEGFIYLWNNFGTGVLRLQVLGYASAAGKPRRFNVSINGQSPRTFEVATDGWEEVEVDYSGPIGPLEVQILTDETWCPNVTCFNGDTRQLGIGVRRVDFRPKDSVTAALDKVSVVIPTYNRISKLIKVLRALEQQTLGKDRFEVIVVDDGSTDATSEGLAKYSSHTALKLRCYKQQNKLQGAARNWGLQLAENPLIVFIGDDIIPVPEFLQEHVRYHQAHNRYTDVAVVGYTTWSENLKVSPFMEFIGECGPQFGYRYFNGNGPLAFDCFYTSNLSLPRRLLERLDYVFDEDFKTYGWEDLELGYRLERRGMRLLYNPKALAYHDHATTVAAFCKRQYLVGMGSRVFARKHPQLEPALGTVEQQRMLLKSRPYQKIKEMAVGFLDGTMNVPVAHRVYHGLLTQNYARGVVMAENCRDSTQEVHEAAGIGESRSAACQKAAPVAAEFGSKHTTGQIKPVHDEPTVFFYLSSQGNEFMAEIGKSFQEGFENLGLKTELSFDRIPPLAETSDLHILVAPHEIVPLFLEKNLDRKSLGAVLKKCACLCVEQPGSIWFETTFSAARESRAVFDINRAGVDEFRRRGVSACYAPLGYRPSIERTPDGRCSEKDIDILFLGHHFERRERFLAEHADILQKYNCHLTLINLNKPLKPATPGYFSGEQLHALLRRSKILLNVHSADRNYFEWQRVLWCIAHRCLVVSEFSRGTDPLSNGEHIILAPREELLAECEHYLRYEDERREIAERAYQFVRHELPIEKSCRAILDAWKSARTDGGITFPTPLPELVSRETAPDPATVLRKLGSMPKKLRQAIRHPSWKRTFTNATSPSRDDSFRRKELSAPAPAMPWHNSCSGMPVSRVARSSSELFRITANAEFFSAELPCISVVIALHGSAEYIGPCLSSVLASRLERLATKFEIQVVDDGTADGAAEIAEEILLRCGFPAELVRKSSSTGLADAWNVGLRVARAPYVFMLAADDLVYPDCLGKLYQTICQSRSSAAYAAIARFDDESGKPLGLLSYNAWDVERLIEGPYLASTAMFDREKVLSVGGYSAGLSKHGSGVEGYDLWLKLAQAGQHAEFRPEILSLYRVHPGRTAEATADCPAEVKEHFRQKFADLLQRYAMQETRFECPTPLEGAIVGRRKAAA